MRLLPVRLALALLISAAAARAQPQDSAQDARQPRRFAIGGEAGMKRASRSP